MRYPVLVLGVIVLAAVAVLVAAEPAKLGPEWTYDEKMKEYRKTMPIKVVRAGGRNGGQNYYFDLQHDKVRAYDTDDDVTTKLDINGGTMSLEIRKDPKGGPGQFWVVVNKCVYHDLDGDGVWDSWYDGRSGSDKCYIRRDGAWVQVGDSKGGLVGDGSELSLDRKTEYTWDGKEWKSRPVDR